MVSFNKDNLVETEAFLELGYEKKNFILNTGMFTILIASWILILFISALSTALFKKLVGQKSKLYFFSNWVMQQTLRLLMFNGLFALMEGTYLDLMVGYYLSKSIEQRNEAGEVIGFIFALIFMVVLAL